MFNHRFGPNGRPIPDPDEPYPTRDFKVETRRNQNDKSKYHTTLSVKRVALANAGTYVVKVKNGDLEEADRFTLEVRSRPEVIYNTDRQEVQYVLSSILLNENVVISFNSEWKENGSLSLPFICSFSRWCLW